MKQTILLLTISYVVTFSDVAQAMDAVFGGKSTGGQHTECGPKPFQPSVSKPRKFEHGWGNLQITFKGGQHTESERMDSSKPFQDDIEGIIEGAEADDHRANKKVWFTPTSDA